MQGAQHKALKAARHHPSTRPPNNSSSPAPPFKPPTQVGFSLVLLAVYWGYLLRAASRSPAERDPALRLRSLRHLFPGLPYAFTSTSTSMPTKNSDGKPNAKAKGNAPAHGHGGVSWVDVSELRLAGALTAQSLFKHLLTQGDKIVLALGSSHYSQGLYALAQNYGSLAARLFFQPLEESGRLMFARLAAAAIEEEDEKEGEGEEEREGEVATAAPSSPTRNRKKMGKAAREAEREAKAPPRLTIQASSRATLGLMLGALVKLVVLVGLVFACFGFNYTRALLRLLLPGKRWDGGGGVADDGRVADDGHGDASSSASRVLSWYCLYVLLLAVNGMTEAFVYAVAEHGEVGALSLSAGASFALFALATVPLMQALGTVGLVLANSLGMAVRVLFSLDFIRRYFARTHEPLPDLFPCPLVLAAFVAAFAATLASDSGTDVGDWTQLLLHVGFGGMAFAGVASTVLMAEGDFLADLRGIRRLARGDVRQEEEGEGEGEGEGDMITIETAKGGRVGGGGEKGGRGREKGRKAE
jgi:hypothetical protein